MISHFRDVETNSNSEDGETLYDYLGSQNDTTQYLHTSPASKLGKLSFLTSIILNSTQLLNMYHILATT